MAKIDRLGWAAGTSLIAYGVRIGIRANSTEALAHLTPYLPPAWEPSSSPVVDQLYSLIAGGPEAQPGIRRFNILYSGPARLARTHRLTEALERFGEDLQLFVAEMARTRLFVHAGVVGWKGKAIVLPGRSYSGKSTLVAALLRAGATYYSDEYALLDARGRVHPFAKPLSLRQPTGEPPRTYPAETWGKGPGVEPLPVGLVVVTEYQPGKRWRPRPLSPGQAVLALLAHTVAARRRPAAALARLQRAVAGARLLKGVRGPAEETVDLLLDRLGATSTLPGLLGVGAFTGRS
jgi:hypothetical protein